MKGPKTRMNWVQPLALLVTAVLPVISSTRSAMAVPAGPLRGM